MYIFINIDKLLAENYVSHSNFSVVTRLSPWERKVKYKYWEQNLTLTTGVHAGAAALKARLPGGSNQDKALQYWGACQNLHLEGLPFSTKNTTNHMN